jgi:hypothetical protein
VRRPAELYTLATDVHLMDDGAGDADAVIADAPEAAHQPQGGDEGETETPNQPEVNEGTKAANSHI